MKQQVLACPPLPTACQPKHEIAATCRRSPTQTAPAEIRAPPALAKVPYRVPQSTAHAAAATLRPALRRLEAAARDAGYVVRKQRRAH